MSATSSAVLSKASWPDSDFRTEAPCMIDVRELTKDYGSLRSLDRVTFGVEEGDVLGFLGPNGAGKTTTMRILTGLSRPTAGSCTVGGFDSAREHQKVRRMIGYLPEDSPGYPEMRADDYLKFMAEMKLLPPRDVAREIDRVLDETGMAYARKRLLGNMSKGMRQRIGLCQALLGDPKVVILDEPTNGLDPRQIGEIRNLIAAMRGRRTVILSTHILSNAEAVCTHAAILNSGRIVAKGSIDELRRTGDASRLRIRVRGGAKDLRAALDTVEGLRTVRAEETDGTAEAVVESDGSLQPAIARAIVERGMDLVELAAIRPSLEEVFLEAVRKADEAA